MKLLRFLSCMFALIIVFTSTSCVKSDDFDFSKLKKTEWNPTLAIPLVSSEYTIMDIIKQNRNSLNFNFDDQGFVTLAYKYKLLTFDPSTKYNIPLTSFSFEHKFTDLEAFTINTIGAISIPLQLDVRLTPADTIRVDSLVYGKGKISISISGTANINSILELTIPEATKNGIPFNLIFTPIINETKNIDLSGYKLDLTKIEGQPSSIRIYAVATLTNSQSVTIKEGQEIKINCLNEIERITSISGYLGQFSVLDEQSVQDLTIFNNELAKSDFSIVNPYLKFSFNNSIGISARLKFSELRSINSKTGKSISLLGNPGVPNPIDISGMTYNSASPKLTTFTITNAATGGVLNDFINIKPDKISYNFSGMANPKGDISQNFVHDTSKLNVDIEVGLPLYGRVKNFTVRDTLSFNINNIEEIENMLLRGIIDNEFPFEAQLQLYFTDDNFTVLDSLVTSSEPALIIPSSQINLSSGELAKASQKICEYNFDKARINRVIKAKKILIKAILNTQGSATQNVKIFNTYKFKIRLATQVELKKNI